MSCHVSKSAIGPCFLPSILSYVGEPGVTQCVSKLWQRSTTQALANCQKPKRDPVPSTKAFFTAIETGNLAGVKAYIEAGGDIEARDDLSNTALLYVARLVKFVRIGDCWQIVKSPDHLQILKYLIENNADVHAVRVWKQEDGEEDFSISTAIHEAVTWNNADYIPLLAKAGASLNARKYGGETPLSMAFFLGHFDCVEALLRSKADPNVYNNYFYSGNNREPSLPLHGALKKQNLKLVKSLIAAKADVNLGTIILRGADGILYSPIRLAKHTCPKAISFLVAAGANVKKEEVARDLGRIGPFIKEGLIRQVIAIEGVAQIILEYSQEGNEILNASIIQDASVQPYVNPRKFLSSESTSGILKIEKTRIISQFVPVRDLVRIIAEYTDLFEEERRAVCRTAPPFLSRLSWECEGEQDAQARSAKINKGIGQLPEDLQERIYIEVFLRSKNPEKPELASSLEQLNWAKEHIGDDMRILRYVIELFFGSSKVLNLRPDGSAYLINMNLTDIFKTAL